MNKRQLVTLVCQEIVSLYKSDNSYKGRDYTFVINFDLFRIKAKEFNMDLVFDCDFFMQFWYETRNGLPDLKDDYSNELYTDGLTRFEQFLFKITYKQVKQYYD